MTLSKKFIALIFSLSVCASLFAKISPNPKTEHPFLTFSEALLSTNEQEVYGKYNNQANLSFPILSYQAPKAAKTKQIQALETLATPIDGEILLMVDDSVGMVAHYFHFMEHLIGIWNFMTHADPHAIKIILFAFEQTSDKDGSQWVGSNETTKILLTAFFPNAQIGLLKDLGENRVLSAKKIHISSRTRSHGIRNAGYENMNGASQYDYDPQKLQLLRDRLFDQIGIHMEPKKEVLRITYSKRSQGRIMDPIVENALLNAIAAEPLCQLNIVDFANISFFEQLSIIANTDLLMGVHGNGFTHLLFLPDQSTVLEYFEGGQSAFFRLFSQLRGLRYFGNSHESWVTDAYRSLKNKQPFQHDVTGVDIDGTINLIRRLK